MAFGIGPVKGCVCAGPAPIPHLAPHSASLMAQAALLSECPGGHSDQPDMQDRSGGAFPAKDRAHRPQSGDQYRWVDPGSFLGYIINVKIKWWDSVMSRKSFKSGLASSRPTRDRHRAVRTLPSPVPARSARRPSSGRLVVSMSRFRPVKVFCHVIERFSAV
jgi:hypothetical protein